MKTDFIDCDNLECKKCNRFVEEINSEQLCPECEESELFCPECSIMDGKGKLIEIEDVDGSTLFRCNRCHKIFELKEKNAK
jgi:hypothetical protein